MKKYILKSGKEVKFGDIIYARNVTGYPSIMLVTLDEDSVVILLQVKIFLLILKTLSHQQVTK